MIVILGSSGFIGKVLFNYFQNQEIDCVGITSKDIDLTHNSSAKKLVRILNKDTVLVFASSIVREKGDNFENMQKNIDMAKNVAVALKISPVKKVIFISSIDVYGKPKGIISEETRTKPLSPYGISKITSEQILGIVSEQLLILRLGGVFGGGQSNKKYGPNSFINSAITQKKITVFGDGKELRDLVFINDLVSVISGFCFDKTIGTINVVTGNSVSFLKIAQVLAKITGGELIHSPRTGEKVNFVFDNSALKKRLYKSFKFTSIEQSLRTMVDAVKTKT